MILKRKYRRSILYILIFAAAFLVIQYIHVKTSSAVKETYFRDHIPRSNEYSPLIDQRTKTPTCHKWIVIYTRTSPTETVKLLSTLYGWCTLVVGDANTPTDWYYRNVVYLGVEVQRELATRHEIISSVPFNSYKRKLIGYAYAIENGAKVIYETDDDDTNLADGLFRFRYERFHGLVNTNESHRFSIYSDIQHVPSIQHGVSTSDVNSPPIVLNTNQYSKISAKNTLYHYSSFWSLVFPLEANNYEEIRSNIAIKLFHLFGFKIAFIPLDLNTTELTSQIVDALQNWSCNSDNFEDCFRKCVDYLVQKNVLTQLELKFYIKWIETLNELGYKWPKRIDLETSSPNYVYFRSGQTNVSVSEICSSLNETKIISPNKIDRLVLITFASSKSDLEYIRDNFGVYFSYMIVCADMKLDSEDFSMMGMAIMSMQNTTSRDCYLNAFKLGFRQHSFLIVMNARKFDFWNLEFGEFLDVSHRLDEEKYFKRDKDVYFIRTTVANSLRLVKFKKLSYYKSICEYYERETKPLLKIEDSIISLNFHDNDLVSEHCSDVVDTKTIWLPDFNDGVRVDVTTTLAHLNQRVVLVNSKLFRSAYPDSIRLGEVNYVLSKYMQNYESASNTNNLESTFVENFAFYQNRSEFRKVDAIYCASPVSVCEGFMSLNRTLILSPLGVYNEGRCGDRLIKLNDNYVALANKSKLILGAMSRYAQEYQDYYTGLRTEYRFYAYAGFYETHLGRRYPTKSEILIAPNRLGARERLWLDDLKVFYFDYSRNKKETADPNYQFVRVKDLYPYYKLDDLSNHPAVIYFPNWETSYSLIELYIAQVPIFVPSLQALIRHGGLGNAANTCQTLDRRGRTLAGPNDNSKHDWLQYANFYQLPFIIEFDSWVDLIDKLGSVNLDDVRVRMSWFNRMREADLLENWCRVLKNENVNGNLSHMPVSYNESLRYFNMKSFQV